MSHKRVSRKTYLLVFIALMALLWATIAAASINLGAFNTPVALAIAGIKASLVILFFMQVRYGSNLVKIFAVAGFFWLLILFLFTMADYVTRG